VVDAGEVLVASGEDGVVDGVQGVTAMSNAWSSSSISSREGGEDRLETCRAAGCFGFVMSSLIPCERNCTEGMRGCARVEEREWVRRGSAWFTVDVGFERRSLQTSGAPTSDFAGLAASRAGGRKGDGEGVEGYL
jgi:hypothetical protein